MGTALWRYTVEDRNYSKDSDDHSLICWCAEDLDGIYVQENIKALTELFDFTGLEYAYGNRSSRRIGSPQIPLATN